MAMMIKILDANITNSAVMGFKLTKNIASLTKFKCKVLFLIFNDFYFIFLSNINI